MQDFFEKLDEQKRERILNAAIAEFAYKSYEDASTNTIVTAAQIGKGMLFHYFGSKKNLYLYLYRYVRAIMDEEVYSRIDYESGSLPLILKQLAQFNMETFKRHPEITDFIAQCHRETSPEVCDDIQKIRKERGLKRREDFLDKHLDMQLLKPEFRNKQTIKLIRWALEGYLSDIKSAYKGQNLEELPVDNMMKDYDSYMDIICKAFYL
ncbi:TetR/AcrR family transcriptional regulator [Desulfitobacterium hafniense]|uniref:TetR/AcrR family transcriptional regulator n=1 Tax=Desulfitobacterium hafniense TaxID=49338 RepID=UPI00035EEB52|nr:TetR/AcrR family transcriptional regulator [Desulfitobacterium hafniense]